MTIPQNGNTGPVGLVPPAAPPPEQEPIKRDDLAPVTCAKCGSDEFSTHPFIKIMRHKTKPGMFFTAADARISCKKCWAYVNMEGQVIDINGKLLDREEKTNG